MTDTGPMPGGGSHRGSKGVAVTNWLVQKASGLLEKKSSRRGFIMGSAMVGSAVAVAGCVPATTPGSPYTHITDCAGGLCTDGYTDFCCTINSGINACPPNSFWGGWWRADYSSFCNGTRYYIDCMQNCCGPATGFQNFCAGCEECRCAGGCDTRRVYCNYFRYGQCHTEIVATGPIACRVVTCVPPYIADPACSTATLVDNSTAEHTSPCITTPPALPSAGAAAVAPNGDILFFARAFSGRIQTTRFNGSTWTPFTEFSPTINSGIGAVTFNNVVYVFARGSVDNQLRYNTYANGAWTGEQVVPGIGVTSDPSVCVGPDGVHVFVRTTDNTIRHNCFTGTIWTGWENLGGYVLANAASGVTNDGLFVVAHGGDHQAYVNRYNYTTLGWTGWAPIGGQVKGSPSVAATATGGIDVYVRGSDDALWARTFVNGSWVTPGFVRLGGYLIGDPAAVADPGGNYCVTWGVEETPRFTRKVGGLFTTPQKLPGFTNATPSVVADVNGPVVWVRGTDNQVWVGRLTGTSWSGFTPIGGLDVCVTALP